MCSGDTFYSLETQICLLSNRWVTPAPCNLAPFVRPVSPHGGGVMKWRSPPHGGGGGMAPQISTIVSQCNELRCVVKIFFGAFGAWYFPCFLGQVTVTPPRGGGGLQGGGALQWGGRQVYEITSIHAPRVYRVCTACAPRIVLPLRQYGALVCHAKPQATHPKSICCAMYKVTHVDPRP